MGKWERAIVDWREQWNGYPVHVQRDMRRSCGCVFMEGGRLDTGEYVLHVSACQLHGAEVERAKVTLPMLAEAFPDDFVWATWQRILDAEIEGVQN